MQIKTQQLKQRNKHETWDRLGGNDMSRIMIDNGTVEVRLNIQQMVTMMGGYSGTGKTYIINLINQILNGAQIKSVGLPDKVFIIRSRLGLMGFASLNIEHGLILVDRLEDFEDNDISLLMSTINKCNNTWIIMGRLALNKLDDRVNFNRFEYKKLKYEVARGKIQIHDELY